MSLSKDDRIAFSLKIVSADAEIKGLDAAKAALSIQAAMTQKLDTANKNLFDPVNALANAYQVEIANIDSNVRTVIVEQDILDSANKKIQNHFFPNDTTATVPSLSAFSNIWPRVQPFALSYALGKNYSQAFLGTIVGEYGMIQAALASITSAATNLDIENTSGQHVAASGTCSLPSFTTQATCLAASGVWTAGPSTIVTYPAVVALNTSLIASINAIIAALNAELAAIPTDPLNQTINSAAKNDISNVILPALNAWLANPDFRAVPGSVSAANFNTYDSNLLAPTKLHSTQLAILQTALNTRLAFVSTRLTQISTILGSINQDVNTGNVTSQSGLYGKRYNYLLLRLNALGGSLTQLSSLSVAIIAQDSIKANTLATKAIYQSFLPTTSLKANASGSTIIHVLDSTIYSIGDAVYVYAEGQDELLRGIAAIQGDMITLNDIVPPKYTTSIKSRMYKDLT